jgi:aerobic C4-dicarboxylate transport protein
MTTTTMVGAPVAPPAAKPWYKVLYIQVLIAIVLGAIVGWLWPSVATNEWINMVRTGPDRPPAPPGGSEEPAGVG